MPKTADAKTTDSFISLLAPGEGFEFSLSTRGRFVSPAIARPTDMVPISTRLPDLKSVKLLSHYERLKIAQAYGIKKPWRALRVDQAGRAAMITPLAPGSPMFGQIIDNATASWSSDSLGLARDAMRRHQQYAALDGNPDTVLIRITEGDDNVCPNCEALGGIEGTLEEVHASQMPGAATCLGGDHCRCTLQPVSTVSGNPYATGAQADEIISNVLQVAAAAAAAAIAGLVLDEKDEV